MTACPTSSSTTSDCDTASMTTGSCAKNSCSNYASLSSSSVCYYDTSSFLSRVCIPTSSAYSSFSSGTESALNSYLDSSTLQNWINDINVSKGIIGASVGIAFGLGLVYMLLLRIFAGLLVWLAIIGYFAGIIILGILCYKKSTDISDYLAANNNVENGTNTTDNKNAYKAIAIILWVFAGLCFVVFLCMYTKIR